MFIDTIWVIVLGTSGPIAAVVLFATHLLEVKKLQLEIDDLKAQRELRERIVQVATQDEVDRYGRPSEALSRRSKAPAALLSVLCIGIMIVPLLAMILGEDSQLGASPDEALFKKYFNQQPVSVHVVRVDTPGCRNCEMRIELFDEDVHVSYGARDAWIPLAQERPSDPQIEQQPRATSTPSR